MAADPNAVPIQPLNIGYSFTPTEYRPQAVNVPTGAGALWAQVGKTAMEASQMLQNSALNPEVREQMKYAIDNYKRGEEALAANRRMGPMGNVLVSTGPQGPTVAAPASISDPTMAARYLEALGIGAKAGGGGSGPAPALNNPAAGDQGGAPPGMFLNPATGSYEALQPGAATQPGTTTQPKTAPGPPTTGQMGKGQASAATASGLSASTDNDFPVRQMIQQRGSSAAPQGTPSNLTFLNPATGNVEPRMFAAPSIAPPPAAPTTPSAPPPPDQTPGSAISQITQQPGVALANWQNQNIHPVVAPKQVLDAVKTNVTTQAQDATYLPNGGVNGEPAWAIHMKGGGQTMISASQLAASPWGKALMAGHNASEVMEQQNQQPPQTNQPGNMLLQPPPAAPAGPLPGAQGQPPAPQDLTQPPAAPGAYNAAAYQMPQGPTITQTGAVNPALMAGGSNEQTIAAAQAAAARPLWEVIPKEDQDAVQGQAKAMPEPAGEYKGDRKIEGTTGPYTYYVDDNPASTSRGRAYTTLPGPAGQYYNQQRWYLGSTEYKPYELPDSAARQQMWDKWGATGFLPRKQIDTMTPQEMEPWLQRAWQVDHLQNAPIDQGTNLTLDAGEKLYKTLTQIRDIQQTLAKNGYPDLNSTDQFNANLEGGAEALEKRTPYNEQSFIQKGGTRIGGAMGRAAGMDRDSALAIRTLDQLVNQAQGLYDKHPELFPPGKTEGVETPNVRGELLNIGTPNIKPSSVLGDVFSGQNIDDKLTQQKALRASLAARYNSLVDGQHTMLYRVQDKHDVNSLKAVQGQDLDDPTNLFKDHVMPRSQITTIADANDRLRLLDQQVQQIRQQLPASGSTPAAPTPTPAPTPSPTPQKVITDQGGYDALAPGSYYRDQSGGLHQKPPK